MPTPVSFIASRVLPFSAPRVFAALIDWQGHADWVPMTKVEIITGDGGVGTEFIATTGLGPVALPDHMRVDALDPDAMRVEITKVGPMLTGSVVITVHPVTEWTSRVEWTEDVTVKKLPAFMALPAAAGSKIAFEQSLRRLAQYLAKK